MKLKREVFSIAIMMIALPTFGSDTLLSGQVRDRAGRGLNGVTISIKNSTLSASTNSDGFWGINVSPTSVKAVPTRSIHSGSIFIVNNRLLHSISQSNILGQKSEIPKRTTTDKQLSYRKLATQALDTLVLRYSFGSKVQFSDVFSCDTSGLVQVIDTASDTSFGISWNSSIRYSSFSDTRDGQRYKSVEIGSQLWMAENLNYSTNDIKSFCFDNVPDSCAKYGRLYTWSAATNSLPIYDSSVNNSSQITKTICPELWRLPDTNDWRALRGYLYTKGYKDSTIGYALKSTQGWNNTGAASKPIIGNGIDQYGFRAIPAGLYAKDGNYPNGYWLTPGFSDYWWTTNNTATQGFAAYIVAGHRDFYTARPDKRYGLSVRCIHK